MKYTDKWLKKHNYDGIYCDGECACEIGDLHPCGIDDDELCEPGYKHYDPRPKHEGEWCISSSKDIKDVDWDDMNY